MDQVRLDFLVNGCIVTLPFSFEALCSAFFITLYDMPSTLKSYFPNIAEGVIKLSGKVDGA